MFKPRFKIWSAIYLLGACFLFTKCSQSKPLTSSSVYQAPGEPTFTPGPTPVYSPTPTPSPSQTPPPTAMSVSISANLKETVYFRLSAESVSIHWTSTAATSCSLSSDLDAAFASNGGLFGDYAMPLNTVADSVVYQLTCTAPGLNPITRSVRVYLNPLTLTVTPTGVGYDIVWTSSGASSCSVAGDTRLSGSASIPYSSVPVATDVTATCIFDGQPSAKTVSLLATPSPVLVLKANGSLGSYSKTSLTDPVTLTFSATGVTPGSCTLNPSGLRGESLTYPIPSNGPSVTTTYVATCAALLGGQVQTAVTVSTPPSIQLVSATTPFAPAEFQNVSVNPVTPPVTCVVVTNLGGRPAVGLAASVPAPFSIQRSLTTACAVPVCQVAGTLNPNGVCGLPVQFSPNTVGLSSQTFSLTFSEGSTSFTMNGNVYGIVTNGLKLDLDSANGAIPLSSAGWSGNGSLAAPFSFLFDGVSSFINLGGSTPVGLPMKSTARTMEVWVNFSTVDFTPENAPVLLSYGKTDVTDAGYANHASMISYYPPNLKADFFNSGYSVPANLAKNTWYQLGWTLGWSVDPVTKLNVAANLRFYVNGAVVGTVQNIVPPDTVSGSQNYAGMMGYMCAFTNGGACPYMRYFPGFMSQSMIYNRVLSSTEIKQNCQALSARTGISCP